MAEDVPDDATRITGARRDRLEADQLVTAACERRGVTTSAKIPGARASTCWSTR